MSDARWPTTKVLGIPCFGCGKLDSCTIKPDGSASKCWRDDGRIHRPEPAGGGGINVGRARRSGRYPARKSEEGRKPTDAHPTPEAAAEAARLAVERDEGRKAVLTHTWPYLDPSGEREAFRVLRFSLGDGEKAYRPIRPSKGGWKVGGPSGPLPLYGIAALPVTGPVYLVEGEKAADAARQLGLTATTSAHGAGASKKTDWQPLAGRAVIILPDNDDPGRAHARAVARILVKLVPPAHVRVVALPGLPEGGDVVQFIEACASAPPAAVRAELEALAAHAPLIDPTELVGGPLVRRLSDVKREEVRWLWQDRIPRGKVTVIAGEGGLGKSFLATDMAARVTAGRDWPDGAKGVRGSVVLANAEDDAGDTIGPRFDAAGGDSQFVFLLEGLLRIADDESRRERGFTLADLPDLAKTIDRSPDCKLVVIDPVGAFLGGIDSYNEAEVRAVLAPLAKLAAERDVAVVLVMHVNRRTGAPAMNRLMGSAGFGNAARAVWMVTKDRDDASLRLFLPVKFNVGGDRAGLAFRIDAGDSTGPVGARPTVRWDDNPVMTTADEAMAAAVPDPDERDQRENLMAWLEATLRAGPVPSAELYDQARQNGFTDKAVRKAGKALGAKPAPAGVRQPWVWSLPPREPN